MNRISIVLAAALLGSVLTPVIAQDSTAKSSSKERQDKVQSDEKVNLKGTWVLKIKDLNQQLVQMMQDVDSEIVPGTTISYRLSLGKNGKLKGNVKIGKTYTYEVKDGSFKDGKVSFSVDGDFAGESFESKYEGKVSGDKIEGKASLTADSETIEFEWNPSKRAARAKLNGAWTLQAKDLGDQIVQMMREADPDVGSDTKLIYSLKVEKGQVKGKFTIGEDYSYEISEGTFKRGKLAFSVKGDFAGESFESKYEGQVKGDKIEGKASVTADYETIEFEWCPTRR